MRIHVLSDLHLEFGPFAPPRVEAEVVVLAGDIDRGRRGVRWARESFADVPVVYVAGNHEYYGKALPKLTDELRAEGDGRLHVLEQDQVEIGGVPVFGCTLWTDLELLDDPARAREDAVERMNDYRLIRHSPTFRRLRPADTVAMHRRSVAWLKDAVEQGRTEGAVIMTHHAPSARSLPEAFAASPLSPCYASALDALVEASRARLWIHGHTHHPVDYVVGQTRVVSNPRGYVDEPVSGFEPALVLDL